MVESLNHFVDFSTNLWTVRYLFHEILNIEHLYFILIFFPGIVEDNTTSLPPDIRAYNALFSTIIAIHQQEYMSVCSKVEKILNKFQTSKTISVDLQEAIRVLKNRVSSEGIKVAAYQRLLRDLLSNHEDLALMNLSVLRDNEDLYR